MIASDCLGVTGGKVSSFCPKWDVIVHTCDEIKGKLNVVPCEPPSVHYNSILSLLCKGHTELCELTTQTFSDIPILELGDNEKIECKDNIANQALVAVYSLRDYFMNELRRYGEIIDASNDIIGTYLECFEKYSAFALCVKCCFTFLQWDWMKWGVAPDHSILPAEQLASELWYEVILSGRRSQALIEKIRFYFLRWLNVLDFNFDEMEKVKRFSINLCMYKNDSFYTKLVLRQLELEARSFFGTASDYALNNLKKFEVYVEWCGEQLRRMGLISCCFLNRSSYHLAQQWVGVHTLVRCRSTLSDIVPRWLHRWRSASEKFSTLKRLKIIFNFAMSSPELLPSFIEDAIEAGIKYSCGTLFQSKWGDDYTEVLRNDCSKVFPICKAVLLHYVLFIRYVLGDNKAFLKKAKIVVYNCAVSFCSQATSVLASRFAEQLVIEAEEIIEGSMENAFDFTNADLSLWILTMYENSSEEVKEVFCSLYNSYLVRRALRRVTTKKSGFSDVLNREKEMLAAFSGVAPFDFLSGCFQTVHDVYKMSVEFWEKESKFYPVIVRQFCCQLKDPIFTNDIPTGFYGDVKRFRAMFLTAFRGLNVTHSRIYSCVTVRVLKPGTLKLVLSNIQAAVLLLFNEKRKWEISSMAEHYHISKEVCRSILNLFSTRKLVRFFVASNEVELLDLNTSGAGTLNLSDAFLASFRDVSFSSEETPRNATSLRSNIQRVEAHIIKILKGEESCTVVKLDRLLKTSLAAFPITSHDSKNAVKKLIERNLITLDTESNILRLVPL